MKKEEYTPLVRQTLADFDFGKAHEYMEFKGWEWDLNGKLHIPSIGELYQKAERLLIKSAEKECCCSSGGFNAFCDGKSVEINFTIAECSCSIDEISI